MPLLALLFFFTVALGCCGVKMLVFFGGLALAGVPPKKVPSMALGDRHTPGPDDSGTGGAEGLHLAAMSWASGIMPLSDVSGSVI